MDAAVETGSFTAGDDQFARVTGLLGGAALLGDQPRGQLDAHDLLMRGLPGRAWWHLVDSLSVLPKTGALERAVGISLRTSQRRRAGAGGETLSREQSGRAWKFAEILARASAAFGGQLAAEQWLVSEPMALDHRRPIDLLATPTGQQLVEDFLTRLEYGVYM